MTYKMLVEMLNSLGNDVDYTYNKNNKRFNVTLKDFAGFDDNYCEIERDFDNEEMVNTFVDTPEKLLFLVLATFM